MSQPPKSIEVQADQVALGVTGDGDVIFASGWKRPPDGAGVACEAPGCGAYIWPQTCICPACGHDKSAKERTQYRKSVLRLLSAMLALLVVLLLRNYAC